MFVITGHLKCNFVEVLRGGGRREREMRADERIYESILISSQCNGGITAGLYYGTAYKPNGRL